jgi:signal transduction histidine kinase
VAIQDNGGEAPAAVPPHRRRGPVRLLSAALFLVLAAGGAGIAISSRRVVADQERRLLQQRAAEVAALFNLSGARLQEALHTASTVVGLTHDDAGVFASTAQAALSSRLVGAMAVVQENAGGYRVVHGQGPGLDPNRSFDQPVLSTLRRAGADGAFVSTPVFDVGGQRRLGYAVLVPGLSPRTIVYAEVTLSRPVVPQNRQSQLFSDLDGALYAGNRVDPKQLVLMTTGFRTGSGDVRKSFQLGADIWLLELSPHHPLVSTLAARQPWFYLLGGLLAAVLVAALVEVLLRRRRFALALVDERTAQLRRSLADLDAAQHQLVQQERLAAIGQLAAAVGHELRNPLGVLANVFYLLRSRLGSDDPWIDRQLGTGEREVGAATLIVSDLLEFSRPRQPVLEAVDVSGVVDEALAVAPPPTGVEVARQLPSELPAVRADRSQLRQVLLNLISNAYDAMPDGGLLVIEAGHQDGTIRLTLSDTGGGIADDVRPRLFEPFFTTKAKGIGLGLSVSHRIVESHGGSLEARAQGGTGASFTVRLPAAAVPVPAVQ